MSCMCSYLRLVVITQGGPRCEKLKVHFVFSQQNTVFSSQWLLQTKLFLSLVYSNYTCRNKAAHMCVRGWQLTVFMTGGESGPGLPSSWCRGSFIGFSSRDFRTPWVWGGRKVGFIVRGLDISRSCTKTIKNKNNPSGEIKCVLDYTANVTAMNNQPSIVLFKRSKRPEARVRVCERETVDWTEMINSMCEGWSSWRQTSRGWTGWTDFPQTDRRQEQITHKKKLRERERKSLCRFSLHLREIWPMFYRRKQWHEKVSRAL